VNLFEDDIKIYSFCSSGLLLNLKLNSHCTKVRQGCITWLEEILQVIAQGPIK